MRSETETGFFFRVILPCMIVFVCVVAVIGKYVSSVSESDGTKTENRHYTIIAYPAPDERHVYHTFRWDGESTGGISFINADTGKRVVLTQMPRIIEEQ